MLNEDNKLENKQKMAYSRDAFNRENREKLERDEGETIERWREMRLSLMAYHSLTRELEKV